MTYFEEIDAWLESLLQGLPDEQMESAKKDIKAEILQSYRNGQKAGVKPEKPFRDQREPRAGRSGGLPAGHGLKVFGEVADLCDRAPKTSQRSRPNRKRANRQ